MYEINLPCQIFKDKAGGIKYVHKFSKSDSNFVGLVLKLNFLKRQRGGSCVDSQWRDSDSDSEVT